MKTLVQFQESYCAKTLSCSMLQHSCNDKDFLSEFKFPPRLGGKARRIEINKNMADYILQMTFRRLNQLPCYINPAIIPVLSQTRLNKWFVAFCDRKSFSSDKSTSNDERQKIQESCENSGKLIQLVVTSLRVDRVAASGLGLARRKVDDSLLLGHVFLNGNKVTKKSRQVIDGDRIDRISENQPKKEEIKFGQVKVVSIGELTKKGNYHIEVLRNKSFSLLKQKFWDSHN